MNQMFLTPEWFKDQLRKFSIIIEKHVKKKIEIKKKIKLHSLFLVKSHVKCSLYKNCDLCYSKEIDVFERARQGEPAPVRTENLNPRNIQEFNELKYKSKNSH